MASLFPSTENSGHALQAEAGSGTRWLWLVLYFAAVFLAACSTVKPAAVAPKPLSSPWSSSDPLSIPYALRLAQFEKGNLVPNPSFEKGAMVTQDAGDTFSLPGWERVGEHVRWVHPHASVYDPQDVYEGDCAVQIVRQKSGEMDAAEGILSDYIAVIPGNYDFTYQEHKTINDSIASLMNGLSLKWV